MNKYLILVMLISYSFIYSQNTQAYLDIPQDHDIFHLWDMDKWDAFHGGKGSKGDDWHDMDFVCSPSSGYENYKWKLTIGNSLTSYSTDPLKLKDYKLIMPSWDSPNGTGPQYLMLPRHFEPTYYTIKFYDENDNEDYSLGITNQTINLYNTYLYDNYNYYESKINSFSASVDWQSGNIILLANILQPELFYLTVKVNGIVYPYINEESFNYSTTNGWERIKTIENLLIENTWMAQNNLIGQLNIELVLDSRMWNDSFYIEYNSDIKSVSINNDPTPTTPVISMSGGFGDNPTLTFSGGGSNGYYYILKKDYLFNSGGNPIHYINPATSPYTDQNVVIERFGGDVTARYSVTAVGPTGIESSSSNIVSTSGNSMWKENNEEETSDEIKIFALQSNYPNPFNPTTKISYQIPKDGFVNLVVYNALGQEVAVLVNQHQSIGKYSVQFNANNLPSGVYIYKLHAGEFNSVKKMLLTK